MEPISVDLRHASFAIDLQAIKRAKRIRILGITVPVATKEDLIVYKLAHFDYRDMSDILTVLKRQKNIDFEYIKSSAWKLAEEAYKPEIKDNLAEVLSW